MEINGVILQASQRTKVVTMTIEAANMVWAFQLSQYLYSPVNVG